MGFYLQKQESFRIGETLHPDLQNVFDDLDDSLVCLFLADSETRQLLPNTTYQIADKLVVRRWLLLVSHYFTTLRLLF